MSLARSPKNLIENPDRLLPGADDVLSDVLRAIRLTSAMQFCFMPTGDWETDSAPALAAPVQGPSSAIPFHIVVAGSCWVNLLGEVTVLNEGDIVAFPFGTGHQLGHGHGGRLIIPTSDLPPRPWRDLPVLRYGGDKESVRLLCGYLECGAINFQPLRKSLPPMLLVRARETANAGWLRATIDQIAAEVDKPRAGGLSMLERLTEITFIEVLRHHVLEAGVEGTGWLAALADPHLSRCLAVIHAAPQREWSLQDLAKAAGLSRSTLADRFESMMQTSPIRYLREWRLFLASIALATGPRPIVTIATDSGYGTEAAFSRAFSRAFGMPPAAWRQRARDAGSGGG